MLSLRLAQEAAIVGVVMLIVVSVVHGGEMAANAALYKHEHGAMHYPQSHGEYMVRLFAIAFVAGALGHLGFEAIGVNRYYCKSGVACSS